MKLFADVNLFIDILEKRENWENSFAVVRSVVQGENEGYVSALTAALIYFLRRKILPDEQARIDVRDTLEGFKLVDLT